VPKKNRAIDNNIVEALAKFTKIFNRKVMKMVTGGLL
jgi:hypothetical protein